MRSGLMALSTGSTLGLVKTSKRCLRKMISPRVFLYPADEVARGVRVDPEGVLRLGFGYFFLSFCAGDAVGRKGFYEVRVVGDFRVVYLVVVNRAVDGDAPLSGMVCEFFEVRQALFRCGDVEFAVGHDEVVLGIDIPEYDAGHGVLLFNTKSIFPSQ